MLVFSVTWMRMADAFANGRTLFGGDCHSHFSFHPAAVARSMAVADLVEAVDAERVQERASGTAKKP